MRNPYIFYKGKKPQIFFKKENDKFEYIRPEEIPQDAWKKVLKQEDGREINKFKSGEEVLETYLSLVLDNYHTPAEEFMKMYLEDDEIMTARNFCKKIGLISEEGRITNDGLSFLNIIQNKKILRKQFWTNILLVTATTILAVATAIQVLTRI